MKPLTTQLLIAVDAYCAATRLSRARVSTLIFGSGSRIDGLVAGKDLNTRSFERALGWLSDNWPQDCDWPADVLRLDGALFHAKPEIERAAS